MEGDFSDWQLLSPHYNDNSNDQITGDLDFGKLWLANDNDYLYLNIELGIETTIQQSNNIKLYIDTDNNVSTGTSFNGIGADLEWTFGLRSGTFTHNGSANFIQYAQIGIVTMPTVSSDRFEIAIARNAQPIFGVDLFKSSTIKIAFKDNNSGQDMLPDQGQTISYSFDPAELQELPHVSLKRKNSDHLRILNYNVLFDGFFDETREAAFKRIFEAVQPDIFSFQEIYNYNATQVAAKIEELLPSSAEQQWYSFKTGPDIIAVSRFPIIKTQLIEGGNGAFLLDLSAQFTKDLFFIIAHPPCCSNDEGRQYEIDAMMSLIRDVKNNGVIDVNENTPIIIMGDMNLVGNAQQLKTLLTGDIINLSEFGPAFNPDWDESDFSDLLPRTTGTAMFYTWYDEASSFSPGRLDFMIYSDSVIEPGHSYVLFTTKLSADTLTKYGLLANDVLTASDHLPIISDFIFPINTAITDNSNNKIYSFNLAQNYSNPFNPLTVIEYQVSLKSFTQLIVYDLNGRQVKKLVHAQKNPGHYSVTFNAATLPSGIYFYKLTTSSGFSQSRKMVVLK